MSGGKFVKVSYIVLSAWFLLGVTSSTRIDPTQGLKYTFLDPSISGSLETAFERFEKLTGINLKIDWGEITRTGVGKKDIISVKAPKATGEQLLEMILTKASQKSKPLSWYVARDKVHITTQMRVLYRKKLSELFPNEHPPAKKTKPQGKHTLNFEETELQEIIQHFRTITKLNFYVNWGSLQAVGITRYTPVTLKASNLTVSRALRLVTDSISGQRDNLNRIYWILDEGVVTIAAGHALNYKMTTRIINVPDILMVVPDFKKSDINLKGDNDDDWDEDENDDSDNDEDSLSQRKLKVRNNLMDIIKNSIGKDMWKPNGKGSIRIIGNKLIITQTQLGFKLLTDSLRSK